MILCKLIQCDPNFLKILLGTAKYSVTGAAKTEKECITTIYVQYATFLDLCAKHNVNYNCDPISRNESSVHVQNLEKSSFFAP